MSESYHAFVPFLDLLALVVALGCLVCRLYLVAGIPVGVDSIFVDDVHARVRRVLCISLTLMVLTSCAMLVIRGSEMSGQGLKDSLPLLPTVLFNTHYGTVWRLRAGALLALWCAYWIRRWRDRNEMRVAMVAAGAVIAWTYSATGHAADRGDYTPEQWIDWLHVLSASLWAGAILIVTLAVRPAVRRLSHAVEAYRRPLLAILERLSRLSGLAVAGVVGTGIYNTLHRVASFNLLWTTTYGNILSLKLALVIGMIMLGALNRYYTLQRLGSAGVAKDNGPRGNSLTRLFLRVVLLEAGLAVTVLLAVGVLIHSPPPMQTMPAGMHHHPV